MKRRGHESIERFEARKARAAEAWKAGRARDLEIEKQLKEYREMAARVKNNIEAFISMVSDELIKIERSSKSEAIYLTFKNEKRVRIADHPASYDRCASYVYLSWKCFDF